MPSLVADPLSYTLDYVASGAALYPDPLSLSLAFPSVTVRRSFTASLGDLTLRLDRLTPIEEPDSRRRWLHQRHCESIEGAFNHLVSVVEQIQAAYNAAAQAQTAATEAAASAVTAAATAESAEERVDQLLSGALAIEQLNVGGQRFVNDGGTLTSLE